MNAPPASQVTPEIQTPSTDNVSTSRKPTGRALLLALLCTILIFLVSSAADLLMIREHEPVRLTLELSDGVSALVIGVLSFELFRMQQQRKERLRRKIELIADMNHHVRNALQVISFSTEGKKAEEIVAIRDSVNRIQWALRELLPKL